MITAALFATACTQNEGSFTIDKNGTITAYKGTAKNLVIPENIGGVPVTSIGESLFFSHGNLISVTIPDGVMYIGDGAFENNPLASVSIPTVPTGKKLGHMWRFWKGGGIEDGSM
jgi:hypothetical protein